MPRKREKLPATAKAAIKEADEKRQHAWDNASEVYKERDWLVRALSKVHPSHLMPRAGHQPKHRTAWVVCIHHETAGQMAWTVPPHMVKEYEHLQRLANDWDGHKTADRQKRLEAV